VARSSTVPGGRLILDSGAIIGWSRGDPRVRELLRRALDRNLELWVPVVVLAEALRGGARDAPVNRVVKATGTAPTTAEAGRRTGALLGATGGRSVADALVAAEAVVAGGSAVPTSDPDDLRALLAGSGVEILRV
jgi:predicted nucleic acid-binding protein